MGRTRFPARSSRRGPSLRAALRLPLRFPLRVTIPIALLASGVVITVVSLFVSYHLVDQRVEQDSLTEVHHELAEIQPSVVRDLGSGDADALNQQLAALGVDPDVNGAVVVDGDGVVVASISRDQVGTRLGGPAVAADAPVAAVLQANLPARARSSGRSEVALLRGGDIAAGVLPLRLGGKSGGGAPRVGFLIIERSLVAARADARHDAQSQALFLAAFVVTATIVVGSFVYLAVARRTRKLAASVERFAAIDPTARSPLGGNDEVAQLGRAFDDMADRITLTQSRLAESEESVRRLLDATAEGIVGLDADHRCTLVNAAALRMLGHPDAADVIGADIHTLIHHSRPDGSPLPIDECTILRKFESGEGSHRDDEVFWRADGTSFPIEYWAHPIVRDGRIEASVLAFVDITDRQRDELERAAMEEQLRQSQRLETVGQLAGGIAHDFNNLLTVIVLLSDSLAHEVSADDHLASEVAQIKAAADRGAELTRQLLTFSRRDIAQPQVIAVDDVVLGVRDLLAGTLGDRTTLHLALAPARLTVVADPGQLAQVLVNLAMNAHDAMPDGGTLEIASTAVVIDGTEARPWRDLPAGEYVQLTVTDTGTGMTPAVQTRAFEPFFTTKPLGSGAGLGLATVYGIVRQFGGAVRLSSGDASPGTTVEVVLPALHDTPRAPGSGGANGDHHAPATVLVVEDQGDVRRLLVRILETSGYRVVTADDGPAALDIARTLPAPPDVVLTDVVMPGMSGSALVRELGDLWVGDRAPQVLYMSGYTDGDLADQGMLADGTELLQKPFAREDLLARLAALLGRES